MVPPDKITGGYRTGEHLDQNSRCAFVQQPNQLRQYHSEAPVIPIHYSNQQTHLNANRNTFFNDPSITHSSCFSSTPAEVNGNIHGTDTVNSFTGTYNHIPHKSKSLLNNKPTLSNQLITNNNVQPTCSTLALRQANLPSRLSNKPSTTSPPSINTRSIAAASVDSLNNILSSLNVTVKTNEKFSSVSQEQQSTKSLSTVSPSLTSLTTPNLNATLLTSLLSTKRTSTGSNRNCSGNIGGGNNEILLKHIKFDSNFTKQNQQEQYKSQEQQQQQNQHPSAVRRIKTKYNLDPSPPNVLDTGVEEELATASPYDIIVSNPHRNLSKQHSSCLVKSSNVPLVKNVPHCSNAISPTSDIVVDMKYETHSGPPPAPPHLSSSGVESTHNSQGTGIVVGGSPSEVVSVDSLLLSSWNTTGPEFLEPPDVKQTAGGLQDWDTLLLGSSVPSAQSLAELKPLPPFTGYTGHLSINGIQGHHYHTIASSAQRSSISSASPTPSSNQEYYESSVVSSSTPCPQVSQKQQQNHQQQHHHQQHHPQQPPQHTQLPQSTQQVEYDIEDIAEIIGSAIADTTVPGGGNGPGSENDTETSRDWIDIADWIDTACSPKTQETTSPSPYSQIYVTATPSSQAQQHGSTLQSLLTQGYAPLLQARLQAGNAGLQNASCGETPSSTSPYPPVSPPGRVSTSCSPDHLLHSSFAAPSHPRKRSRPAPGSQNASKKNSSAGAAALSPYGAESGLIGGKEKPVHRCSICNRGFLNKSNIKVHLRTHTGEKPFRCEVCGKAFRQKAHLIKHQQIHKRIGRD